MIELLHIVMSEESVYSYERGENLGFAYLIGALRNGGIDASQTEINKIEEFDNVIQKRPAIIGFSPFIHEFEDTAKYARLLKEAIPEILIVWGGIPVTSCMQDVLKEFDVIDIVIRADGEETFLELARRIKEGKPYQDLLGIVYRKDNEIIVNDIRPVVKNLDELPLPSHDLLENKNISFARISSSRGCYGYCTFCSAPVHFGKEAKMIWRGGSIRRSVDEMWSIYQQYGIREFYFSDASIEDPPGEEGKKRLHQLAQLILEKDWETYYRVFVRGDSFSEEHSELLKMLCDSGLEKAFVGVESVTDYLMKIFKKRASLQQCVDTIQLFRRNGILVEIGFIYFTPYSTMEDMRCQADFLHQIGLAKQFSYFVTQLEVYPGTPIKRRIELDGLLRTDVSYRELYCYMFQNADVEKLCNIMRRIKNDKIFNTLTEETNTEMILWRMKRKILDQDIIIINKNLSEIQNNMNDYYYNIFLELVQLVKDNAEDSAIDKCVEDIFVQTNNFHKQLLTVRKSMVKVAAKNKISLTTFSGRINGGR